MLQPTLRGRGRDRATGEARRVDPDRLMDHAIAAGLTLLILTGFITSYRTLCQLAITEADYPPWLAPAVPISLDLGIIVLSLRVLRAARTGRNALVLRAIVAVLALGTVALNTSAAHSGTAAILHAAPPAIFVICFESVVVGLRRSTLAEQGLLAHLPRVSAVGWLLAPRTSWHTWKSLAVGARTVTQACAGVEDSPVDTAIRAAAPSHVDRAALAAEVMLTNPATSASTLAEALARQGVMVSLRTAQRLRARALVNGAASR